MSVLSPNREWPGLLIPEEWTVRNAYILINFGDFVDGALAKVGDPYIQLLPLTDPAEAHRDFVQARLGGVDDAGSLHLLPVIPESTPAHAQYPHFPRPPECFRRIRSSWIVQHRQSDPNSGC